MKKKKIARFLAIILIASFCVSLIPMTASAAYVQTANYNTYGTYYKCNSSDNTVYNGSPDWFNIRMYGEQIYASGTTGTISDGVTLAWTYVHIYLEATDDYDYGVWFRLKKDGQDLIFDSCSSKGNASRMLYEGKLADGTYEIQYLAHEDHNILFVNISKEYNYLFHFTLDATPPVITGASTSTRYTNSAFTVSAADATSGFRYLWYKRPGDTSWQIGSGTPSSYTFAAGSTNGLYTFYSTDLAWNNSEYHYVYYDNVKPVGTLYKSGGSTLTSTYTNGSFYYKATDSGSGISYLQIKRPGGYWTTYTAGTTIQSTDTNGTYQFRAIDKAGNISDTKSVILDSAKPTCTIFVDDVAVSDGSTTVGSNIKFVPTDATSGLQYLYVKKPNTSSYSSYTSGTKLTGYGLYQFYCKDYAGNTSATYSATLQKPLSSYTVSYNANGGSNAPASQTKTEGTALTLTTAQPTRTGYNFLGWSTSSSATSATYKSGGTYSTDASTTLYAVWQRKTYAITYNANGGSGAPSAQIKTYGTSLTLSSTVPTRSGYTFLGWSTSSSATSASYSAGGTFSGNYATILYAVWQKNPEKYTISFNANGGSGAPSSQTKTENVTLTLPTTIPTKQYYKFLGWSTNSTATTASYAPGDSFTSNGNYTLYAVWEYAPGSYVVRYNANGGSGSPSAQTKTGGINLTLSSTVPTKSYHTFLGWATNSTATTAEYQPGAVYSGDSDLNLYAVWQKDNYEFSISNLKVVESDIYRYGTATVTVRTDSWDKDHAYSNIPVQLYYDGKLISTQYVNFAKYGVANSTFTINVGDTPGNHTLEARVNWSNKANETNTGNNSVTTTLSVKDYEYEMSITPIDSTNVTYTAGNTVVSSFSISNDSEFDITPDMGNLALFKAYYYEETERVMLSEQTWHDVVIPSGYSNLVYFKWTVPDTAEGKTVFCECTANANGTLNEQNTDNNTAAFEATVNPSEVVTTPNTSYERNAPAGYHAGTALPTESSGTATWSMWTFENGGFVLKRYGVTVNPSSPSIIPDSACITAKSENGTWEMKSGYGIELSWNASLSAVNGYSLPSADSYTAPQSAIVTFPEYSYSSAIGRCDYLDYNNGELRFRENRDADGYARVHFVPVYVENGDYAVSLTVSEIWTPVGKIFAVRNSNAIRIKGTIYDDYYVEN